MTRTSARLTTLLAATALMGGAMAVNCSKGTDNAGVVRLALQIPPDYTVSTVHWSIQSSTNTEIKSGNINTADLNATASVDTSCPAGSGDRVVMTATATSAGGTSVQCTGTSAPFNVTAGGSVMVGLTLVCGGGVPMQPNGNVVVNGNVIAGDNCPLLTQWEASPLQTTSGAHIQVSAMATDSDVGQTLTYAWTATSGSYVNAALPATDYICGAPGDQTLTITVSDSYMTPCTTAMNFSVHCVGAGVCGNGTIEAGEQCDPPNGTNCSATCQHVVFCGDSVIEAPETCDPPNAATHCGPACTVLPFCGDGHVDPGETCDPPNGGSCSPTCQSVVVCTSNACTMCEQADQGSCPNALNIVPGGTGCYGCEGFAMGSNARLHCEALLTCIRTTNCSAGDDPTPCLCGTLPASTCASAGPPATAACATQYAAAAADAPGTVFSQFGSPTAPVGIANNQAACRIDSACACP